MAVLVTGGAGYIGSHMVQELSTPASSVVVLDNLSTGFRWAVPAARDARRWRCRRRGARRDRSSGTTASMRSSISPARSWCRSRSPIRSATIKQHRQVARPDRGRGGERRRSISSSPRPPPSTATPRTRPIREDARSPMSPYGSSKLMTEIMLRDTAPAHDFRYVALRYFNVAGADPKRPHRPVDAARDAPDQGRLRDRARQAQPTWRSSAPTIDTPDGTCMRDYIHVSDLVAAHYGALAYPAAAAGASSPSIAAIRGLFRARGDRGGQARLGRDFRVVLDARSAGDSFHGGDSHRMMSRSPGSRSMRISISSSRRRSPGKKNSAKWQRLLRIPAEDVHLRQSVAAMRRNVTNLPDDRW